MACHANHPYPPCSCSPPERWDEWYAYLDSLPWWQKDRYGNPIESGYVLENLKKVPYKIRRFFRKLFRIRGKNEVPVIMVPSGEIHELIPMKEPVGLVFYLDFKTKENDNGKS